MMTTVLYTIAALILGGLLFAVACGLDYMVVNKKRSGVCSDRICVVCPKYFCTVALGAALAVFITYTWGFTSDSVVKFLFLAALAAVTLIDMDTMEIPDFLPLAIVVIGILSFFTDANLSWYSRLIGIFCVSVPLTLISLLVPGAFGGGDIKLMAACGLILGWKGSLLAGFIGILLGGLWGAVLLISKKKKGSEHFAFGPCLCVGCAICAFAADTMGEAFLYIFDLSRFF